MNLNTKVRLLQLANHIIALPAVGWMIYTGQYQWLWATFLLWILFTPISVGVTMHRLLTHKSFKTYKWLERTLSVIASLSTIGPTISWVALHRMHHANTDLDGDPHTPYIDGKWNWAQAIKVWFGYEWKIPNIPVNYVKDLMREPIHRWLFNNYFKVIFAYCIVLALINPILIPFAYCLPAVLAFHAIGSVNVLGHAHGYRNYETKDQSTNSWISNLLTWGEGWHNTHHAHPTRWHLKDKWWEWDLIGDFIRLIRIK